MCSADIVCCRALCVAGLAAWLRVVRQECVLCVCGFVVRCVGCVLCESKRSYGPAAVIVASMRVQLALRGMSSALCSSRCVLCGWLLRRGYRRACCRSVSAGSLRVCVCTRRCELYVVVEV